MSRNHSLLFSGHTDLALLLIQNGAEVNAQNAFGYTPLHWAVSNGHLETVKVLVENGANVWIKSGAGQTPRDMANSRFIKHRIYVEINIQFYILRFEIIHSFFLQIKELSIF